MTRPIGPIWRRIKDVTALLANTSPPDFVLNRHCPQCEFQLRCRKEAVDRDELTLLSGMTEKQRKRLHERGIFTVTQLSFTSRPRRRSWARRGKKEKFHQSLRARAIREKKIHTVDLVDPKLSGTPVYLEVDRPQPDTVPILGQRCGGREAHMARISRPPCDDLQSEDHPLR